MTEESSGRDSSAAEASDSTATATSVAHKSSLTGDVSHTDSCSLPCNTSDSQQYAPCTRILWNITSPPDSAKSPSELHNIHPGKMADDCSQAPPGVKSTLGRTPPILRLARAASMPVTPSTYIYENDEDARDGFEITKMGHNSRCGSPSFDFGKDSSGRWDLSKVLDFVTPTKKSDHKIHGKMSTEKDSAYRSHSSPDLIRMMGPTSNGEGAGPNGSLWSDDMSFNDSDMFLASQELENNLVSSDKSEPCKMTSFPGQACSLAEKAGQSDTNFPLSSTPARKQPGTRKTRYLSSFAVPSPLKPSDWQVTPTSCKYNGSVKPRAYSKKSLALTKIAEAKSFTDENKVLQCTVLNNDGGAPGCKRPKLSMSQTQVKGSTSIQDSSISDDVLAELLDSFEDSTDQTMDENKIAGSSSSSTRVSKPQAGVSATKSLGTNSRFSAAVVVPPMSTRPVAVVPESGVSMAGTTKVGEEDHPVVKHNCNNGCVVTTNKLGDKVNRSVLSNGPKSSSKNLFNGNCSINSLAAAYLPSSQQKTDLPANSKSSADQKTNLPANSKSSEKTNRFRFVRTRSAELDRRDRLVVLTGNTQSSNTQSGKVQATTVSSVVKPNIHKGGGSTGSDKLSPAIKGTDSKNQAPCNGTAGNVKSSVPKSGNSVLHGGALTAGKSAQQNHCKVNSGVALAVKTGIQINGANVPSSVKELSVQNYAHKATGPNNAHKATEPNNAHKATGPSNAQKPTGPKYAQKPTVQNSKSAFQQFQSNGVMKNTRAPPKYTNLWDPSIRSTYLTKPKDDDDDDGEDMDSDTCPSTQTVIKCTQEEIEKKRQAAMNRKLKLNKK